MLVVAVSNAKVRVLARPELAFAHPRLYLPFLSAGKVGARVVVLVLVIAGFVAERPLPLKLSATQRSLRLISRYSSPICSMACARPPSGAFANGLAASLFATGEPVRVPRWC